MVMKQSLNLYLTNMTSIIFIKQTSGDSVVNLIDKIEELFSDDENMVVFLFTYS